jgi:hypothetical protein
VSLTSFAAAYCACLDFSAKGFGVLLAFSVGGEISSCNVIFLASAAFV